jgi:PucR C-terminal helix-turn-helix domain
VKYFYMEALPSSLAPRPAAGGSLPCLLSWVGGDPTEADLRSIRAAVRRSGAGRVVTIDRRRQVLLVGEGPRAGTSEQHLRETVAEVARAVHDRRPEAKISAVIGQRMRAGEPLDVVASRLSRVERQALARGCEPVASARHYSLACLLERLDAGDATTFVEEQLATLAAHDREHGTDLLRVVELALDHRDRNAAARAAFMHRNTFRRRLRRALKLIDADLECPEERLALHLALKMRTLARGSARRRERVEQLGQPSQVVAAQLARQDVVATALDPGGDPPVESATSPGREDQHPPPVALVDLPVHEVVRDHRVDQAGERRRGEQAALGELGHGVAGSVVQH